MPYASRRQQRRAHATRQPFARRWDKETPSFAALPEKKDAGVEAGAPLHGPGGSLATPGMRKWGRRKPSVTTKPMTRSEAARVAALARWGKYTPRPDTPVAQGISLSKQPKPTHQATPEPPRAARRVRGGGKGRAAAKPKKTDQQRQDEQQAKRTQREQERAAQHETKKQQVYERLNIAPDGQAALEALRRGEQPDAAAIARGGFVDAGLVEQAADGSYRMTPAGRALTAAAESGDAGRAGDTISGARDRLNARRTRRAAAEARKRETEARRTARSSGRGGGERKPKRAAPRHSTAAQRRLERTRKRLADAIERARRQTQKSFAVFKSADGAYRWIARTSTAYRDRDGEIVTTKALEADAARMTATGQYGPLRYWHIGQPDPFNPAAPWGIGLDIGECDYSIVIGRTSIESGTFKSAAIGRAFAESADDYELSPGFFHPPDQPNAAREYDTIRRFERSVVPVKYGRASNLFTGMTVKEHRMDQQTYEARVKAFMADMNAKGVPPEVAAQSLASMEQADKSATQQGIAYKSDDAPTIYYGPNNQPGVIQDGLWIALKAAPPVEAEPEIAVDEKAPPEMMVEGEPGEGGEYIGDMTPAEFWMQFKQYLAELLAPQAKMEEMAKAMASGLGELKSLYTTKDAGTVARIAALETELATLKGDQPAVVENEALAALKSKGPQPPPDASAPQIPDDPNRPLAGLGAQLLPQLYGGAAPQVQGFAGANGWQFGQPPQNTGGN